MTSPDTEQRSPKRQRRSFSPASPPESDTTDPKASFAQPPQTPPPSVHMSPSWTSQQLPGLQYSGNGNGSGSVTFPTPPSTAGFQSQMMGRGPSSEGERAGDDSGALTPVVEEGEGGNFKRKRDEDGDAEMAEAVGTDDDAEHRRSDHERQRKQEDEGVHHVSASTLPGAKVLYKLHTDPISRSQPHPTQNLLNLYSLHKIQSSVARRDPLTGEKINKLRKSYEGKVKDLGIEGRNKATKSERILEGLVDSGWSMPEAGGSGKTNWEMSDFADPVLPGEVARWDQHVGVGGMLEAALEMRAGALPRGEHESWKGLLGLDDLATTATTNVPAAATVKALPATTAPTPNGAAAAPVRTTTNPLLARTFPQSQTTTSPAFKNASAPSSPRPSHLANGGPRPERTGKKRRYDESSYAGYQEGYDDDDGYSTGGGGGEERRRSGLGSQKRQRRKESYASSNSASTSPTFSTPAGGAGGGGMVGVRSS